MKTALLALVFVVGLAQGGASTVWTGPGFTFTKADNSDPTLEANQDRLNNDVWLTRGATRGVYNIKIESAYGDKSISPAGTRWAFQGVEGNPNDPVLLSATNYAALSFDSFANALGGQVGHVILGRKGVLHLVAQDVYLDVTFTSWSIAGGGGFTYTRSTSAPEAVSDVPLLPPWCLPILGLALAGCALSLLKQQAARKHPVRVVFTFLVILPAPAATVWTGPDLTFTKLGNTDVNLEINQDRINDDVWLTRGTSQAIYNIRSETAYAGKSISPAGTRWAFLGQQGNTADPLLFGAANYSNLAFLPFADALGGQVGPLIVGRKGVLHLLEADAYLDITFNSYSSGGGGGAFSYTRATPVPEPAAISVCVAFTLAAFAYHRRRNSPLRAP